MSTKVLKISIPGFSRNATLDQYIDFNLLEELNWEIRVNSGNHEADVWFVSEDVPDYDDTAFVAKENIFFGTAETARPLGYFSESSHLQRFLAQFSQIFTHHDLYWNNVTASLPFLGWMINSNHGPSILADHPRNHVFLSNNNLTCKKESSMLSVFCSNQDMTPGHRLRFRFVEELKKYFGDKLHWYGNGIQSLPEKWDGLAPYKYTIVLENHIAHNVITEKLYDAYLANCYPIYWGAPNVRDYFDPKGLTEINISDFTESKRKISALLDQDVFSDSSVQVALNHNRSLVLNELNHVSRIVRIAEKNRNVSSKKESIRLRPSVEFLSRDEIFQNQVIQLGHRFLRQMKKRSR